MFWGAHAPRVLVSAPRRNQLGTAPKGRALSGKKKVRDDEGVIASTRGACAPQMRASPRVITAISVKDTGH